MSHQPLKLATDVDNAVAVAEVIPQSVAQNIKRECTGCPRMMTRNLQLSSSLPPGRGCVGSNSTAHTALYVASSSRWRYTTAAASLEPAGIMMPCIMQVAWLGADA
jgi:hypothetical protein